jgi:CHAT domain-containing protein/tetratricopeptide (TPR) repeat protein
VVELQAGQLLDVVVDQQGIDVVVRLHGPAGDSLAYVDSPNGDTGPEPLELVAEATGTHLVTVAALEPSAPVGRYAIRLRSVRAASAADRARILGNRAYQAALGLRTEGTAGSLREARRLFSEALSQWHLAGVTSRDARALLLVADIDHDLGDNLEGLQHVDRALELFALANDSAGQTEGFNLAGSILSSLDRDAEGIEQYQRGLSVARLTRDSVLERVLLNNLAGTQFSMGRIEAALSTYQAALELARRMKDERGEAAALGNLGMVYSNISEDQRALDLLRQSLELRRRLNDRRGQFAVLNNLASVYTHFAEYERANAMLAEALALARALGALNAVETLLNNIGTNFAGLGQADSALTYYRQALVIAATTGKRESQARTLNNIGHLMYDALHDTAGAIPVLDSALVLWRAVGAAAGEGPTLGHLAKIHQGQGDSAKALRYYEEALALSRRTRDREFEARTLHQMSILLRHAGFLDSALVLGRLGLRNIEDLRRELLNRGHQASYFGTTIAAFGQVAATEMALHHRDSTAGWDLRALETLERSDSRRLLDALADARVEYGKSVDSSLMAHEQSIQRQLDSAATVPQVQGSVQELLEQLEDTRSALRRMAPEYAALTSRPLLVAEIQDSVLDDSSLFLEYTLGDTEAFVWAVSSSFARSYRLASPDEIRSLIARYRAAITARNQVIPGESAPAWRQRVDRARREVAALETDLGKLLLGPITTLLHGQRLLIVGRGALSGLPFASLILPGQAGRRVIDHHEIVVLPSASVVAVLRELRGSRTAAPGEIVVVGDPVFDPSDPRVLRRGALPPPATAEVAAWRRAARDAEVGTETTLPRLAYSREEAAAIRALVPSEARLVALDFDASRGLVSRFPNYRIVHLATHALVDDKNPAFSGIALSMVDSNGRLQDGYLRLHEIFGLRLSADLVVLSACQTAVGKEVRGEGLMSLSRAFMYAGAVSVIGSLWKVDDQATADLMRRFYARLLGPDRMRPATALRLAQRDMATHSRWRDPYYWAGFVLQGDWR